MPSKGLGRPGKPGRAPDADFRLQNEKPELAARIEEAVDRAGGAEAVAAKSGVPKTTLYNYIRGDNEPKATVLGQIAVATGASLDWLVLGGSRTGNFASETEQGRAQAPEAGTGVSAEALEKCVALVEEWLSQNKRTLTPQRKAHAVVLIYQIVMEDLSLGKEPIDSRRVGQFLRLVA